MPRPRAEQVHRVLDLDVRGEDEDRDLRQLFADRPRRLEPLGRVGRRHADVDDRESGRSFRTSSIRPVGVARLADDVVAPLAQQSRETFPKQHVVVGDRDPLCALPSGIQVVSTPSERRSQPAGVLPASP